MKLGQTHSDCFSSTVKPVSQATVTQTLSTLLTTEDSKIDVSSRQKVLQFPSRHLEQNGIKKLVAEHKKSDTVLLQWCSYNFVKAVYFPTYLKLKTMVCGFLTTTT